VCWVCQSATFRTVIGAHAVPQLVSLDRRGRSAVAGAGCQSPARHSPLEWSSPPQHAKGGAPPPLCNTESCTEQRSSPLGRHPQCAPAGRPPPTTSLSRMYKRCPATQPAQPYPIHPIVLPLSALYDIGSAVQWPGTSPSLNASLRECIGQSVFQLGPATVYLAKPTIPAICWFSLRARQVTFSRPTGPQCLLARVRCDAIWAPLDSAIVASSEPPARNFALRIAEIAISSQIVLGTLAHDSFPLPFNTLTHYSRPLKRCGVVIQPSLSHDGMIPSGTSVKARRALTLSTQLVLLAASVIFLRAFKGLLRVTILIRHLILVCVVATSVSILLRYATSTTCVPLRSSASYSAATPCQSPTI